MTRCESCQYEGEVGAYDMSVLPDRPSTKSLCDVCSSTFIGKAVMHCDGEDVIFAGIRSMAMLANRLFTRLDQLEERLADTITGYEYDRRDAAYARRRFEHWTGLTPEAWLVEWHAGGFPRDARHFCIAYDAAFLADLPVEDGDARR